MYVQVSIPISSFKTFTYSAKNIDNIFIFPGQSVVVPFRNVLVNGFIVSIIKKPNFKGKILSVKSANEESFRLPQELWKTINWISRYYICSIGKTLHSTIPFQHITKLNFNINKKVNITDLGMKELLNNKIRYTNQIKILKYLKINNQCLYSELIDISKSFRTTCKRLEELNLINIYTRKIDNSRKPDTYTLTSEQIDISKKIISDWKINNKPALLSGISGSGKTLIYIDLIKSFIKKNQDVIVLVPEIALIKELYNILDKYFPGLITSWHSKMKISEKKESLLKIKTNQAKIVISTRSGLFAPLSNLGLIVVDEEQESSYKEDGKSPYYNSRDVALMRANFSNSKIILVSSSPSLESFFNGKKNSFSTYSLQNRFNKYNLPKTLIINMKNKENYGKGLGIISRKLIEEIENNLNNNKQILLLHNRIGDHIKKIENKIKDIFPNHHVARYDRESVKVYGYNRLLNQFHENKINILLGTQMIAKGIDFKNVSLVGILNADLGITSPDFRADEKLFQLAYQFIGRAGRHSNQSKAIIQTFNPDDIYIKSIYEYNIKQFYSYILEDRKSLFYPPYSRLIRIIVSSSKNSLAQKKSNMLYDLFSQNKNLQIIGPSEAPIHQKNSHWRYHLLIKMKKNYWIKMFDWIDKEVGFTFFERNTNNLKIKLDVDPIYFL